MKDRRTYMTQLPKTDKLFDRVFRSILDKMPQLIVPLINEVFHTDYRMEDTIMQLENQNKDIMQGLEWIMDSLLHIGDKKYYIECQQTENNATIVRIFEYNVIRSLEEARERSKTGVNEICIPNCCELYLTHTASIGDSVGIPVRFADNYVYEYQIPVIKVQSYSKEEMFQKNLLILLPYYILRYEKELPKYEKNEEKKNQLLEEYKSIKNYLNVAANSEEYSDLIDLIKEVLDYVLKRESRLKEELDAIMDEEEMELFSERMMRIGREQAFEKGREEGRKLEGVKAVDKLVDTGIMDLEAACSLLEVSLQDYEKVKDSLKQEK